MDRSFLKGLAVLEAVARADGRSGVTRIARELGITKSNAHRLLRSLVASGARAMISRLLLEGAPFSRQAIRAWKSGDSPSVATWLRQTSLPRDRFSLARAARSRFWIPSFRARPRMR